MGLYTIPQAAKELGIPKSGVMELIQHGTLTMRLMGGMSPSAKTDTLHRAAMSPKSAPTLRRCTTAPKTFQPSIGSLLFPSSPSGSRWPPTRRLLTAPRWRATSGLPKRGMRNGRHFETLCPELPGPPKSPKTFWGEEPQRNGRILGGNTQRSIVKFAVTRKEAV